MKKEEIEALIAQGEDSRVQFKVAPIGVSKLATELTAFTNSEGGIILFGVSDIGEVVGLDKEQRKCLDNELSNACNDNVRPPVYPRTEFHTIDGKVILAVYVSEGVSKPYADKSGNFWVKAGPDKRRVTAREELQRMLQRSLLIHADELPVDNSKFSDIDLYHFGEFLEKNYAIPASDVLTPGKVDIPQLLTNLGFASGTQLTLAGVMLFGKTPQRFLPLNMVKCVAFVGNEISGSQYRDSEDFTGTIRDMYKSTMAFIMRNLRHEQRGQDFNSIGIPQVPEGAISELIANMFLHRDYFVASPWRVLMFDDRIEIHSPGRLPNHQDIAKIKAGVSVARNSIIFTFATKEIPYRGLGSGIKRALELYPNIEFENRVDVEDFVATVRYAGVITPCDTVNTPCGGVNGGVKSDNGGINDTVNAVDDIVNVKGDTVNTFRDTANAVRDTVNAVGDTVIAVGDTANSPLDTVNGTLNSRIVSLVRLSPGVSRPDMIAALGVSESTIARCLRNLRSTIEFRGAPKNGGYYVKGAVS